SPLFRGEPSGNEGTAVDGRFHHQAGACQTAQDAVTPWKVAGKWWRSQGELGEQQPILRNGMGDIAVTGRINAIQARADHGDRAARATQGAFMSRRVYAQRQSTNYGYPRVRQRLRKRCCRQLPLGCGVTASHDGDRWTRQQLQAALGVE